MVAMKPNVVVMMVLAGSLVQSAAAAPDPRIATCRQEQKLRNQSACLSKIVDAATTQAVIDAQLDVAREALVARPEQSISGRQDFEYAAENAGIVAAKTSIDRLTAHVVKGDATAQRFGLRGLAHALSLLRMGYANGGDRDRQMRAEILGAVGSTCRERLASPDELVITEAFRCVGETRDRQHAAAMVKAIANAAQRGKLARAGVLALREIEGLDAATVKPLVRILENPLPASASSDDVWVRADVCRLFSSVLTGSERWAQLPAKTAAERIGKSNSQAREACERLDTKLGGGGAASGAPPASSGKNWFPSGPLESCRPDRIGILGDAEVCVFSDAAGPSARKYRLAIEDVSKLDPKDNTRHAAIVSVDLRVRAGEYIHVETVAAFELSDGRWLIIVPVVAGTPDSYTAKHAQLHVLDTATKKLALAQTTTPCRGAACQQDVQLSRKKGVETPVDILVQGDAKQKLVWDGKALRPAR